jgi:hypothetical protein
MLSIIVKFADIPIQIIGKSKADLSFLRIKYSDYLIYKCTTETAKVYLIKARKYQIIKKSKIFLLYSPIIRDNFAKFNIYLRRIFLYLINRNNGFILHASSILKNNSAYIFCGPAGAGKSTIRKLFPDCISLGDDSALMRKIDDKYYLFGSPFYQTSNISYPNSRIKNKHVYIIHKSNKIRLKDLNFPDNLKNLLQNSFLSFIGDMKEEKEHLIQTVFDFCKSNKLNSLWFIQNKTILDILEKNT